MSYEQFYQLRRAESSGNLEPGEMVGGPAPVPREHTMKSPPQQSHRAARQPLQSRHRAAQRVEREIERPPNPADAESLAQARHRIQHRRRQVRVLVVSRWVGRMPASRMRRTCAANSS